MANVNVHSVRVGGSKNGYTTKRPMIEEQPTADMHASMQGRHPLTGGEGEMKFARRGIEIRSKNSIGVMK